MYEMKNEPSDCWERVYSIYHCQKHKAWFSVVSVAEKYFFISQITSLTLNFQQSDWLDAD